MLATPLLLVATLSFATFASAGCGARSELLGAEPLGQGGSGGSSSTGAAGEGGSATTTSTTATTTSTTTTTTTSTSTGTLMNLTGCADGEREGFTDIDSHPDIAGCSGGFDTLGLFGTGPDCVHTAGDDGNNVSGQGCSAVDLCSPGWHVCSSAADVAAHSPTGCAGAAPSGEPLFFVTAQSGTGCGICATGNSTAEECTFCACASGCLQTKDTANDLFGCGNLGLPPNDCGVLDRFSDDQCAALGSPWLCAGDGCSELFNTGKFAPEGGGALCCRD